MSFFLSQPVNNADFIIPVEIDGVMHQVWVNMGLMGVEGCGIQREWVYQVQPGAGCSGGWG